MKRRWGMRTVSVVFFVSARLRQNCALGLAGRFVFGNDIPDDPAIPY